MIQVGVRNGAKGTNELRKQGWAWRPEVAKEQEEEAATPAPTWGGSAKKRCLPIEADVTLDQVTGLSKQRRLDFSCLPLLMQ